MAYENNRFCWHGIISTDPEKAKAFYPEVIGWKAISAPMGDGVAHMFAAQGVPLAHYMAPPMPGVPSHWVNYLRVDDVDARTKTATANGGQTIVPPNDIPPGRFSVVTSPSGAQISLFHEADEAGSEHHPGGTGGVHWVELQSQDIDADLEWLKSTLGYEIEEVPMPRGDTYYHLKHGGEPCAGARAGFMANAPSMWLTWIEVDDAEATVTRVKNHGGQVFAEAMEIEGVGRMAVVADPTGAVFGVITPAEKG